MTRHLASLRAHVSAWAAGNRLAVTAMLLALVTRVIYWQVTERKFEDGLITIAHARSVAEGIGLTHHPGEPVTHGFTTALSVLIPTVGELLDFLPQMDGFLMLRLVSLVAVVAAIFFANRIANGLGVATFPKAFALLFLAVDYNHIFYGMAGMETQVGVAILLGSVDAAMRRSVLQAGILFGLCPLARPDFLLFVGPALLGWFLADRRSAIRVGGLAAAVVAPWVIFTTAYFGSPVPNTIYAKSLRYPTDIPATINPGTWWDFVSEKVAERELWWHTFTPFLENGFVVDAPLLVFFSTAIAVGFIGFGLVGVARTVKVPGWAPALAFLGLYTVYRMLSLPPDYYEWYYPPITGLLAICAAAGLTHLARVGPRTIRVMSVGLVAAFAWSFPAHVVLDERIQHDIENKVRVPMGLWLRDNVPPGQTVTSESAGYVGYFGRVKLYDYPGLTSKEARAFMEELGEDRNSITQLINAARPNFIVMRPNELEVLRSEFPDAASAYAEARRFSVPPQESDLSWGGVTYVNIDRDFIVLRRVRGADVPVPDGD